MGDPPEDSHASQGSGRRDGKINVPVNAGVRELRVLCNVQGVASKKFISLSKDSYPRRSINPCSQRIHTAKAQYRKFETTIPRKKLIHSCFC